MAKYSDPLELLAGQERRFSRVGRNLRRGHEQVAEEGLKDAKKLTRGRLTRKQTKGQFARRGGQGKGRRRGTRNLLPINIQHPATGLHSRMRLKRKGGLGAVVATFAGFGGRQSFSLTSGRGRSNWVINPPGTRKMVARGFHGEIRNRFLPRNFALLKVTRQDIRT